MRMNDLVKQSATPQKIKLRHSGICCISTFECFIICLPLLEILFKAVDRNIEQKSLFF